MQIIRIIFKFEFALLPLCGSKLGDFAQRGLLYLTNTDYKIHFLLIVLRLYRLINTFHSFINKKTINIFLNINGSLLKKVFIGK
jgi:hypothetical protein